MMDDGVWRPILCRGEGVLIIIKDGLNAFPIRCPGDLDSSGVDSVHNTVRPAAAGFHNEALTQSAAKRLQGHNKLLPIRVTQFTGTLKDKHMHAHGDMHMQRHDNAVTWHNHTISNINTTIINHQSSFCKTIMSKSH